MLEEGAVKDAIKEYNEIHCKLYDLLEGRIERIFIKESCLRHSNAKLCACHDKIKFHRPLEESEDLKLLMNLKMQVDCIIYKLMTPKRTA